MELWIRSQDKERLIKVNNIEIEHKYTKKEVLKKYMREDLNIEYEKEYENDKYIKSIIYGDNYCLGKYKTKERALEVLDEIQYNIEKIGKCELTDDGIKYYTNIYEMPEE